VAELGIGIENPLNVIFDTPDFISHERLRGKIDDAEIKQRLATYHHTTWPLCELLLVEQAMKTASVPALRERVDESYRALRQSLATVAKDTRLHNYNEYHTKLVKRGVPCTLQQFQQVGAEARIAQAKKMRRKRAPPPGKSKIEIGRHLAHALDQKERSDAAKDDEKKRAQVLRRNKKQERKAAEERYRKAQLQRNDPQASSSSEAKDPIGGDDPMNPVEISSSPKAENESVEKQLEKYDEALKDSKEPETIEDKMAKFAEALSEEETGDETGDETGGETGDESETVPAEGVVITADGEAIPQLALADLDLAVAKVAALKMVEVQKEQYAVAMEKKEQFTSRRQSMDQELKEKQVELAKGEVDQAMVASVLEFLTTNGHMFSSTSYEIRGADLSAFLVMCKGERAALDILQRLEHGSNVFDSWPALVDRAQEVMNGGHHVKVTAEDRVEICNFLTRPEIDLITELEEARLEDYVKGLPASAGALADEEVTEALNEILQAGMGVESTKKVLSMMIKSHLVNLPLWDLAHEVHLASRFLPHPATEAADVDRVVEFLQDSPLLTADFELEYGDLVHLLHKTLGIEGCLNRLRLLERSGTQFHNFTEFEAGVEPLQLPTKATRELLSEHLKEMQLVCPEMELDELLLVGGSVDEVRFLLFALCSLLSAFCFLFSALCSLLSALCCLLSAVCSLPSAHSCLCS
jgi:hypothetical protein